MLRGVAILGILPVNAAYFAYAASLAEEVGYPAGGSVAIAAIIRTFFEYKFISLFSLLFGVGIGIQYARAETRKVPFGAPMVRRLIVLAIFGILHATLLWYGDIVFIYALVGLVLCWFAGGGAASRAWAGAIALCIPIGLLLVAIAITAVGSEWFVASSGANLPDGVGAAAASGTWDAFFDALMQNDIDPDFEIAVYAGPSFARAALLRTVTWIWMLIVSSVYFVPRIAGLCLLGMAAVRSEWALAPNSDVGRRRYRALAMVVLPVAALLEASSTAIALQSHAVWAAGTAELLHYVASLGMAAGYAAVIALVVSARPNALWTRPFAAIGRIAFTCYIGQSLVMTTLFYGHGFALFDSVSRWELMGIVALVWSAQLILAPLWLTRFRVGPLEWIWRSATHLEWQPLLRSAQA